MNDLAKRLKNIEQRIGYLAHIKNTTSWGNISGFQADCEKLNGSLFDMDKDKLTLFAESVGSGEAKVELHAMYGGDKLALQFNPNFFMDFLRQVEDERVIVKFKDAETAAMTKIGSEYTYVVMPLVTH